MQIETHLSIKSMVLINNMCWLVFPIFLNATNTLKQSLILTYTLLKKLKLNNLDCYGDFEDLTKNYGGYPPSNTLSRNPKTDF